MIVRVTVTHAHNWITKQYATVLTMLILQKVEVELRDEMRWRDETEEVDHVELVKREAELVEIKEADLVKLVLVVLLDTKEALVVKREVELVDIRDVGFL